jgi:selenocysteine-specific elongation factor
MVAGATGIDMVAMGIAADEGVMPQTREHMEICVLLGIQHGLIALTKIDLVDEEWRELVMEDIASFVQGTFLEDQPIVPLSSATREGLPEFVDELDKLSTAVPDRLTSNLFRLPVDRVFTMKGFGTVITGSLTSGHIRVGDGVMLYPSMVTSKVRGIQVHGRSVEEAGAGLRTAVNFQGLEKASVNRGDVLSMPGALKPSYMVDVSLHYLKSNQKPVKNRSLVRFHTGTSEIMGNLMLLDREDLKPGEDAVAQVRLDTPVALVRDDRYVIRSYSPVRTIGGGMVLNPIPQKHKRFKAEIVKGLKGLMENDPEKILAYHVSDSGIRGVSFSNLAVMSNLSAKQLDTSIQALLSRKEILQIDKENRIFLHRNSFDALQRDTRSYLQKYHESFPLKAAMPKEELKSKLPATADAKIFTMIFNQLIRDGIIAQEGDSVRLSSHRVSLGEDQAGIKKRIVDIYRSSRLQPPYFKEAVKSLEMEASQAKDVLMLLVEEGTIVKIKEDLYFHAEPLIRLKENLVDYLLKNQEITTPQFKDMTGASRKYVIPLMEYFDKTNVTIRVGDTRKLRQKT